MAALPFSTHSLQAVPHREAELGLAGVQPLHVVAFGAVVEKRDLDRVHAQRVGHLVEHQVDGVAVDVHLAAGGHGVALVDPGRFGPALDVRDLGVLDEVRDDAEHGHVLVEGDAPFRHRGDGAVSLNPTLT